MVTWDISSNSDELVIHPYLLTCMLLWLKSDIIWLMKVRIYVFNHGNVKLDDPTVTDTSILGIIASIKPAW